MMMPTGPVVATQAARAPTTAAAGSVNSQASDTLPAMPQRTAARPRAAPAPKIDPVATCVVDRGKPRWEEVRMTEAVLIPDANPCAG